MMRFERLIAIRLVSHDAAALAGFYVAALGFDRGATATIDDDELGLLGISGTGTRITLTLSGQVLEIDQFDPPGEPYPKPRASDDRLFQHFAMITADMTAAWAQVLAAGGEPVSIGGPVQLPPENASVRAVKFRDPEGHPLELLAFPDAGQRPGINHSAIVVRDVAASIAFYAGCGLAVGRRTLNHGPTQAALDGLLKHGFHVEHSPAADDFGSSDPAELRVDIVPMSPPGAGPHLELLGYRDPPPRLESPWHARDVAATRLVWTAASTALIVDPDGHLHQCRRDPRPLFDQICTP